MPAILGNEEFLLTAAVISVVAIIVSCRCLVSIAPAAAIIAVIIATITITITITITTFTTTITVVASNAGLDRGVGIGRGGREELQRGLFAVVPADFDAILLCARDGLPGDAHFVQFGNLYGDGPSLDDSVKLLMKLGS